MRQEESCGRSNHGSIAAVWRVVLAGCVDSNRACRGQPAGAVVAVSMPVVLARKQFAMGHGYVTRAAKSMWDSEMWCFTMC